MPKSGALKFYNGTEAGYISREIELSDGIFSSVSLSSSGTMQLDANTSLTSDDNQMEVELHWRRWRYWHVWAKIGPQTTHQKLSFYVPSAPFLNATECAY